MKFDKYSFHPGNKFLSYLMEESSRQTTKRSWQIICNYGKIISVTRWKFIEQNLDCEILLELQTAFLKKKTQYIRQPLGSL